MAFPEPEEKPGTVSAATALLSKRPVARPQTNAEVAMPDSLARSLLSLTRRLGARPEGDAGLLAGYVAGHDPAAFAELVQRHGPLVLGVCRRMLGHLHDADDAFQATFLILARGAGSVRNPAALPAWLYRTAVRVCQKARRKRDAVRPRRPAREGEAPAEPAAADDPFATVAWQEVRALLDEELGRLPESLRAPLVLCYLNGLSRDEAAGRLGWSKRTLMRRLEQARQSLRRRLQGRGVAALGLGAAVLAPRGLLAAVPESLAAAAVTVGTGGPVSAAVQALAGGAAGKLFPALFALTLLLAGGGLGLAALSSRQAPSPPAVANADDQEPPPPGKAQPLDADGRPLPAGAVRRLGSRRFRAEGRNDFALPTPDGRHLLIHPQPLLSSSAVQGLMLVDADTGLRVRSFEGARRVAKSGTYEAIRPAAFSPDGQKLYALAWHRSEEAQRQPHPWASLDNPCKRVLLVWDVATGKRTAEWDLPSPGWGGASLLGVTASPDGKRLYLYGAVRMQLTLDGHGRPVPGVHVLDAATGRKLQTWEGAGQPVGMTAGGQELVTFRRGAAITAHDPETGKPVRTFPLAGFIPDVALSVDGRTVAAVALTGEAGRRTWTLRLWEAGTGREIRTLTINPRPQADPRSVEDASARLVFAADGKTLYLGSGAGRILRWDLSDGHALPDWPAHSGRVADLFLRPGKNEVVSAGAADGVLRRWDPATGKCLSARDAYVGEVAFTRTHDGKGLAAVDAVGRLDLWDVATGRIRQTLQTPGRIKHQLLFTPDGKHLLVAAQTGPNTVWDLSAGKQVATFEPPPKKDPQADEYWWYVLAFSPDGRHLLASKSGRGTWVWTWPERKLLWHDAKEKEACFFPDGKTVVCGAWQGPIEVRDVATGAVLQHIASPGLTQVAFSPDRLRMVTTHLDGTWRVRDAVTGAVRKEGKGLQKVWSASFSPSGWLLAVAGDNAVRVFDTASWQEVARCDGHDGTVRSVFFGPDEATLISASAEDGTALVWSLRPPAGREAPDPEKLWAELAGDGPAVRQAVWAAARHPDVAVQLFRQKWPVPEQPGAGTRIRKLVAELDSEKYTEREAAEVELTRLGRQAEAELRKALAGTPSEEVKRRAGRIVEQWEAPTTAGYPPGQARELRAVWALELAGTPEAKKLLADWATARVGNRLCEEAAAALKRLQRRER
jgi:RNA polymerase sigma factor (sigma-70 family)